MTRNLQQTGEYLVEPATPFGLFIRPSTSDQLVNSIAVETLKEMVRLHRLVVLRGFAGFSDVGALTEYAHTWGEIMMWPFGAVLDLIEKPAADHIFGHCRVPMHWDGMYREYIPEFQIFSCVDAPPATPSEPSGRTQFVDTTRVLANTPAPTRAVWAGITVTYHVAEVTHYGGRATSPLVTEHPTTRAAVLRFNEPPPRDEEFPNPHQVTLHGVRSEEARGVVDELVGALYDPRHCYAHAWRTGDLVLTDNYTLLHGRESFRSGTPRRLWRVHVLGDPPAENHAIL